MKNSTNKWKRHIYWLTFLDKVSVSEKRGKIIFILLREKEKNVDAFYFVEFVC